MQAENGGVAGADLLQSICELPPPSDYRILIDTDDLPNGVYFVQMRRASNSSLGKFVVMR